MEFDWNFLLSKFQPSQLCTARLSFVQHETRDVKFDGQVKLFLLTTLSGFIGLCRVSIM